MKRKCKCKHPELFNPYSKSTHCIKCGGDVMKRKKKKSLVGWTFKSWKHRFYFFDTGSLRLDDVHNTKKNLLEYTNQHIKPSKMVDFFKVEPMTKVRITLEEI